MTKRILIVEDEKDVALLLKEHLERLEYDVEIALDGKIAIEKVREHNPHVVILDIVLPQIDGLEVLKWIKQNYSGIPVILTSIKKDVEDLKKGYLLRADYYITKPYSLEEVVKGINIMLSLKNNQAN